MISRRHLVGAGAALTAVPGLAGAAQAPSPGRPIRIDMLGGPGGDEHDLRGLLRSSGMTAFSETIGVVGNGENRYRSLLEGVGAWRKTIADNPDALLLVQSGGDIARADASGRCGIILNVQDTSWLDADLSRLATAQALGLRIVQLTYNVQNLVGDGAIEPTDGGLSLFGRRVVAEIERRRMAVDLSHGGRRTMAEAAALAKRPIVSHTGARALAEHPRNIDDALMRAVADKGGFVGMYFMPYLAPGRPVTADDVVRHLDHAVTVCGEDHVAVGTDGGLEAEVDNADYRRKMKEIGAQRVRDGVAAPGDDAGDPLFVAELNGPTKFELLAERLRRRGWTSARIDKVLGVNAARVLGEIWG